MPKIATHLEYDKMQHLGGSKLIILLAKHTIARHRLGRQLWEAYRVKMGINSSNGFWYMLVLTLVSTAEKRLR